MNNLLDAVFGYAPAQIVHVAARLGIADLLADGPKGSDELAEATGTHEPSLRRLLRGLACLGGVTEIRPGVIELTETGRPLRSDVPDSIRRLVMLSVSHEVWRSWGELEYSVRTGEPAWDKVTGMSSFAYFDTHPDERATFNAAMSEHTRCVAAAFIAGYDFSRFGTLADLGGGNGTLVAEILRAISGLRCLIYDRSSGLEGAPENLTAASVTDRCELVEGDFFESVPAGADAYVLKSVIHDWDDEQTVAIFRNCAAAMTAESVLLVIEPVLPERKCLFHGSSRAVLGRPTEPQGYRDGTQPQSTGHPHGSLERNDRTEFRRGGLACGYGRLDQPGAAAAWHGARLPAGPDPLHRRPARPRRPTRERAAEHGGAGRDHRHA